MMLRIWCTIRSSHHVHSGLPTRDSSGVPQDAPSSALPWARWFLRVDWFSKGKLQEAMGSLQIWVSCRFSLPDFGTQSILLSCWMNFLPFWGECCVGLVPTLSLAFFGHWCTNRVSDILFSQDFQLGCWNHIPKQTLFIGFTHLHISA
jgi:hypothetical protein